MNSFESFGGHATITGDLFKRNPEVLEVFRKEQVTVEVKLETNPTKKYHIDIYSPSKRISLACHTKNDNIKNFTNCLKDELVDMGIAVI